MRKKILAANWKMNLLHNDALELIHSFEQNASLKYAGIEVIVFPSALYISELAKSTSLSIGAQNVYFENAGAFTGEVSLTQIKSVGASYVLIGHSERRQFFHETNTILKKKVDAALKENVAVIFCCGEELSIREAGNHVDFVVNQLKESLFHLDEEDFSKLVIAYEPIWAIGTGVTASSAQAEDMHREIRNAIEAKYGSSVAENCPILYGGSCNEKNAAELFACPNVDGGLIGGASLKNESFGIIADHLK